MFKITPVQDKDRQKELCQLFNIEFRAEAFAYITFDIDTNALMGMSQFEIVEVGYIFDLKEADGLNDFEAMFILSRQTMNFIESCGTVHCYAGNREFAEKFLEIGAFCGVTGMVTFKKAENIRENLKVIPLERLFIETDAPYLAPVPHRGRENHPGYLIHVAAAAAEQYGISTEKLAENTYRRQ